MARRRSAPDLDPDPTWFAFTLRHTGHPFLAQDPLYALRADVLEAIAAEIPRFVTPEDESFELDLARSTRHGSYLRRPIGSDRVGFAASGGIRRPLRSGA